MTQPAARRCRSCGSEDGLVVLDLGRQPSAEDFTRTEPGAWETHPLRMWLCRACGLAQLAEDPGTPEEQTSVVESRAARRQAQSTLRLATRLGLVPPGSRILELGSPHAPSWDPLLRRRGLVPLRDDRVGAGPTEPVDVVLDVYGLLHEPDQHEALERRARLVGDTGTLLLQLHPLGSVLRTGQFAELRHGHFAYWSLPALDRALGGHGLGVHRARLTAYDGGTLTVVATRTPVPDVRTQALLRAEADTDDPHVVGRLQEEADRRAGALRAWLQAERDAGRRVAGYGAAGRAVPLLCHAGVDATLLTSIADASPAKHGRFMPGTDVPIVAPGVLAADPPDTVLLLVGDLLEEVRTALPEVERAGGRWVVHDRVPDLVPPGA